ncbi:amidase [Acetobacter pasteurianus]|uniref:Amidase n=2 Tax=Acetobacter pasteurianus TaxID=438 RepID=C7JE15_ACEP3|nr:amidase [Acetobacter pasteurianus]ASC06257.1 Asparaginyl-tRNA synthase (glutamine-hydrolyzing) [Acetobacter pasteurianus subsp. pasteurianus]BAI00199.1 amidase [Acetobacter pasteurianus IFO 3283-01]BAI03252.1 amidase [Acetobacter pasteurianus IFO 3283-03]BAI06297.1 amidase [Acetobacter pasteurianus IFO 3283-07]BAI09347.1 amidase [Acetobacter pasteurianus IFO 3283-22]
MPSSFPSMLHAAHALADGRTTARELVENALAHIADSQGEGARTFMSVHATAARGHADAMDKLRCQGQAPSPLAGLPISVKDLFDEAGSTTRAGSMVLADAPPASMDAPAIARLKQAGLISIGRTTMTEFAFSGIGINPHFGTPANPWRRDEKRIPGGSSSGAAVSVSDNMAFVGIGSDTGGSCRIPAALTGLVGYKPTSSRISTQGTVPLSSTLDSIGSIGRTVACCWAADSLMATGTIRIQDAPTGRDGHTLRLGMLSTSVMEDMDETVAHTWEDCLSRLSRNGVILETFTCPPLTEIPKANSKGGFPAAESLAWHQHLLETRRSVYDPFVLQRILRGYEQTAVDYIALLQSRAKLIRQAADIMNHYDAVILPTVPIIAPKINDMNDNARYVATNLLLLRNTTIANFLDLCAISLPCHHAGEAPVGLMVMGRHAEDCDLFHIAAQLERILAH